MRFLTYVLRSINLLNVLLIVAVAVLAAYVLFPMVNMKVTYKPSAVEQTPAVQEEKPAAAHSPSPSEFMVVAEQNLFHPERKIPVEKTAESQAKPDIILYGTLVGDDMRLAYIEDQRSPQSTPGRGKRQSVVKQGDTVSGFVLKNIETDRIVLARGDEQVTVYLTDARKTRTAATSPQPAVTQPGARPGPVPTTQPFPRPSTSTPGGTPAASATPAASPAVPGTPPRVSADRVTESRQQRSQAISRLGTQAPAAPGLQTVTPIPPQPGK
jgi:hypothetical protein